MARVHTVPQLLNFFLYFSFILCVFTGFASANRELDEHNWRDVLEGEWMIEFYAPWCPACNALSPAWKELSSRAIRKALGVRTGGVDVTKSPGLSGRFFVTALPTIFHVIDGEFRQYKGPRDADSMLGYVEDQQWKNTEPIPSWKAPHSIQMTLVAEFFKLSQALRGVHNMLLETYGMPTWVSYTIFSVATIVIGALLGLMLVCFIDLLYPPRREDKVFVSREEIQQATGDKARKEDDPELVNDDIVDDEENSDAEKNSASDSSDEEKETPAEAGDVKPAGAEQPTEVRKRRPRKAD